MQILTIWGKYVFEIDSQFIEVILTSGAERMGANENIF